METERNGLKMKYFVLTPAKGTPHGFACRMAMRTYAKHIAHESPDLAEDIIKWMDDIEAVYNKLTGCEDFTTNAD